MSKPLQNDSSEYEFKAKLTSMGQLTETDKPVKVTRDIDPKWYAEFTSVEAGKGKPPVDSTGIVRYAVHSPALRGLTGNEGKVYRISGKLVIRDGHEYHDVTFVLP